MDLITGNGGYERNIYLETFRRCADIRVNPNPLLAVALMGVDPPEFIEAIKLMQEVVTELDRIYGHAHRSTSLAKNTLESIKERFRKSLEEMRVENESRETMDINKRPKQQEKRDCIKAQQDIAKD